VKIAYGTKGEKAFLCGLFMLAAAASAIALARGQMLAFPHLRLPLALALCALLLASLPAGRASGGPVSRGLYRVLPSVFLMGAIFLASSLTMPPGASVGLPDLVFHFGEFFALGLLTARMVDPGMGGKRSWVRPLLIAFSLVAVYGLLDEVHQAFVPGRNPSLADFLVDASAGLAGILAYRFFFVGPAAGSEHSVNR
jgi:VanZ family protein